METTIYYFTGTGNSLKVARDLSKNLYDCELIPIAKVWQNDRIVSSSESVGFIFPLYAWGVPRIIHDFVNKIELGNAHYIFAVVTRSGDINGIPLIQIDTILRIKSKSLSSGFFIKMPNNYILDEEVFSELEQKETFEKARKQIQDITQVIKENKKTFELDVSERRKRTIEKMNKAFHKGVNESDRFFYADKNCNNCGICERVCPINNLILVEGKPQWQHKCQQCLACINYCPEEAIQYGKKTLGRGRYHYPDITVKDLLNQKQ